MRVARRSRFHRILGSGTALRRSPSPAALRATPSKGAALAVRQSRPGGALDESLHARGMKNKGRPPTTGAGLEVVLEVAIRP